MKKGNTRRVLRLFERVMPGLQVARTYWRRAAFLVVRSDTPVAVIG